MVDAHNIITISDLRLAGGLVETLFCKFVVTFAETLVEALVYIVFVTLVETFA